MMSILAHGFSIGSHILLAGAFLAAVHVAPLIKDLPDHRALATWEPAGVARVYASDGELMTEYARERRFPLPIEAIPEIVKQAFLSAEDKNFYSHPGLDPLGLLKAVIVNLVNFGSDRRLVGASTITQQVVKNLLLTPDRSIERKIREAVLSLRMEQTYSKDKILEFYLNSIYLGAGSYGVAAASQTYFGKPLEMLGIAEAALLAALPKAPNNYNPFIEKEAANARRNWVLRQMAANGLITPKVASREAATPLHLASRKPAYTLRSAEYFSEEVRQALSRRFGADALHEGGFAIRTTLDPRLQETALAALRSGLIRYDEAHGYRGAVARIDPSDDWQRALAAIEPYSDVPEWRLAVVLGSEADHARVGLRKSSGAPQAEQTATMGLADMKWALRILDKNKLRTVQRVDQVLHPGDVVYVEKSSGRYRLRQPPEVQGALVSLDPKTGRVLAMVGGFSFSQSKFNRATQAYRQPGSAFKPFVYAAALDAGYTPATLVMDAPLAIPDGAGRVWRPKNYDGRFSGPSTLRTGLEKSRNLMTVRLARHLGMDLVVDYGVRFGLYDELKPYLPMALGAGETTLMRLVSAYAVFANGGEAVKPSLVDSVEDRYGQTLYQRACDSCVAANGRHSAPAQPDYVLDPMTAYQITSMMRGVVERGTASSVGRLGVPIAGKTGTTNDEKDVWFVGFTPDIVTGVFMGFDTPRPMGYGESGGGLAAPIFIDFMKTVLRNGTAEDFDIPEGLTFMAVDRHSGRLSSKGSRGAIMEAFKPGTAPCRGTCPIIGGDEAEISSAPPIAENELSAELREKLLNGTGLY